jgi:WD40 repeat protein
MGNDANPEKDWTPADHSFSCDKDVAYIKASPNEKLIAVGYGTDKIRIFDVETNVFVMEMEGCCYARMSNVTINVDFSPDSKVLAYRWENEIRFMDIASQKMVRSIPNEEKAIHIAYSPNGKFLMTGNKADVVKVFDLEKDSSIAKVGEFKARSR